MNATLADDVLVVIFEFLPAKFVISTCAVISKPWHIASKLAKLSCSILRGFRSEEACRNMLTSDYTRNFTKLYLGHPRYSFGCALTLLNALRIDQLKVLSLTSIALKDCNLFRQNFEGLEEIQLKMCGTGSQPVVSAKYSNIKCLTLTGILGCVKEIASNPCFINLVHLDLSFTDCEPNDIKALTESPYLINITDLVLNNCCEGIQVVKYITSSKMNKLTTLELEGWSIGSHGCKLIAESPTLRNLKNLNLSRNEIEIEGLQIITSSPNMSNLQELDLTNALEFSSATMQLKQLPRLTSLSLQDNQISDSALKVLCNSPLFTNLTLLDLKFNQITDAGLTALASCNNLTSLKSLHLASNHISSSGVGVLLGSDVVCNLTCLDLSMDMTLGSLKTVVNCPRLNNLRELYLGSMNLGVEGAKIIATGMVTRQLTNLSLYGCSLGDDSMKVLAESSNMQNLTQLNLNGNGIGPLGVKSMVASKFLDNLSTLHIFKNPICKTGVELLRTKRNLEVFADRLLMC